MLQADVADPAAVEAMFTRVEKELGPVSILVNNATPATLESYDAAALERMRSVNMNGVIHTVRAVIALQRHCPTAGYAGARQCQSCQVANPTVPSKHSLDCVEAHCNLGNG
jgi:NAD(P)-dependent dehydrogenase (short-subunit alcohol dehydrogenase family)